MEDGEFHLSRDEVLQATIYTEKQGGGIRVLGNGESAASMDITEHGGRVNVQGQDINVLASMNATEHGGSVAVTGKGRMRTVATMGVNQYGNGAVSTWDKNGNRLATLK